jgi:tetratricopeptide (TPR) repeat protein
MRDAEIHFHNVAELSLPEREVYFQEHEIPVEIRAEVEALLRFDSDAGESFAESIAASAKHLLDSDRDAEPGSWCGPYVLTRVLGRGGSGCVYLAERADGEVEQRVAIKLLRHAREEPAFIERFLQERQILATLNHPGIARLLDAGRSGDGRPYLAMEYVDGTPIDAFAESLDLPGKLGLFLRLCDAVSYAHRNLVIHRDIKPSNILVDSSGNPKLLDFGIAKIVDAAADQTATRERLMTPEYASPEQVRGLARSTATDLYSLGAVLYKLLTGRPPHGYASTSREAVEFAINSAEPEPPSAINPAIQRDLDFIVLKALRKEPEERYGSADAFADDVRAFLEFRPVRARSGNLWYRTRKFVRRYWAGAAAAGLVVASLSAGLYVSGRERARAQRRFAEVRQLAHTLVFDLHDEIARLEGATKTRETIVRIGLEYLDHLAEDAGDDQGLQAEIAAAYMKIGEAQGFPTRPNLGRLNDALASYRKAGDIYRRIAAKNSAYTWDLGNYYLKYAGLIRFSQDPKQARAAAETSIQTFDSARATMQPDLIREVDYIAAWCTLGDMDEDAGDYGRSLMEFQRCQELARLRLNRKRDAKGLNALSQADERIATSSQSQGRLAEALTALDDDESALRQLLAAEPRNPLLHRRAALAHLYRSSVYFDDLQPNLEDPARSLESAKRYLAATEEMVRNDPSNKTAQFSRAVAKFWLSVPLREIDVNAAVVAAKDSARMFDDLIASGDTSYLTASRRVRALERLGEAQLRAGRADEARRSADTAISAERELAGKKTADSQEHAMLAVVLILGGQTSAAAGDSVRAERLLVEARSEAQEIAKLRSIANVIPLAHAEEALGRLYARSGRIEEARVCYERLAGLWGDFHDPSGYAERRKTASLRLLDSLNQPDSATP